MGMTHYATLGAHRGSTPAQLRALYQNLVTILHPDKHGGTAEANARFAEITGAYAVLRNEKRRRVYDKQLRILGGPCPACKGEGCVPKQKGFTKRELVRCNDCNGSGVAK